MGGQPAFSGNTSGRSKGNMYGEAGRGKGQAQRRGGGGGGDWKNQKSRLQMAQEEDALEATLGYANFTEGDERLGWLMNMCAVRLTPRPTRDPSAATDFESLARSRRRSRAEPPPSVAARARPLILAPLRDRARI